MQRLATLDTLPSPHEMLERPGQPMYFGSPVPEGLDLERIVVHTAALRGRLRAGGMQDVATYPTTSQQYGFSPVGEGSTAQYSLHYSPEDRRRMRNRQWPTLNVMLGTEELPPSSEASARRSPEQIWARASDIALRDSMRAGARRHLCGKDLSASEHVIWYAMLGADAVTVEMLATGSPNTWLALGLLTTAHISTRAIGASFNKILTGSYEWGRTRWDLAGGSGVAPELYWMARPRLALPGLITARK